MRPGFDFGFNDQFLTICAPTDPTCALRCGSAMRRGEGTQRYLDLKWCGFGMGAKRMAAKEKAQLIAAASARAPFLLPGSCPWRQAQVSPCSRSPRYIFWRAFYLSSEDSQTVWDWSCGI